MNNDLVDRLLKRAEIRRGIQTRKSVQEGKPDRISDLLEESATEIEQLREINKQCFENLKKLLQLINDAQIQDAVVKN
jgi:hypothetical protein